MQALAQRLEFAPPPVGGALRSLALALLAHALLLAALTWGVNWRRSTPPVVVVAELWSASAIQAMARPEAPVPAPAPEPPAALPVPVPETPAPRLRPPVDIALEQEARRLRAQRELEQERAAALARQREDQRQAQVRQREGERLALEARRRQEQQELQRKAAADKLKAEQEAARRTEQDEARRLEVLRQENIRRMTGLAGAAIGTGQAGSSGNAAISAGPAAADYAGRIRARIRSNIAYSGDSSANPTALVEVRTSPDGTIINRRLLRPSGVAAWDEAALKAIDKTEKLPANSEGKVPPVLEISIRPRD